MVIELQIYDIVIAVYECFRAKIQMRSVRVCSVLCPLASQLKFSFGVDFVPNWGLFDVKMRVLGTCGDEKNTLTLRRNFEISSKKLL